MINVHNVERRDVSIHAPIRRATCPGHGAGRADDVSIHAPVRRATCPGHGAGRADDVSIHAPVRRATAASSTVSLTTA